MSRFMLVFNDNRESVTFQTMPQVRTYLDRSVPDATSAIIYEKTAEAIRNRWGFNPPEKQLKKARSRLTVPAKHAYKKWTATEHVECLRMNKAGFTAKQIADKLGRSPAAIRNRIEKY